jgi:hypothetical protein
MGPASLFYKYLDVLDPGATVVTKPDNDAIVLVELNNHVSAPVIDHPISKISINDNVIFVSMTETIFRAEEYSQRYGLKFMTIPVMNDTANVKNLALVQPFLVSPDLFPNEPALPVTGPRDYLFLNLNRRATASRMAMHAALDLKKLIAKKPYVDKDPTKGLVSMHWLTITTDTDLHEISSGNEIVDHATTLADRSRVMTIPINWADDYAHWKYRKLHHYPKWYSDTWFSLVTESTAHAHYVHKPCLSEKTVMPMLFGHPFLLYADNGAIQLLRELGFDTFDWLFDHSSYDTELDPLLKLKSILRLIKNFNVSTAIAQVDRINEAIKFNQAHCRSDAIKQAVSAEWQTAIEELVS